MTSQWYMNVNKARPRHAPTWRKAFKWTHFPTISKREWISTVIVYVYEVIWSIHFHSIKWNYDNRIGESPWRSWCYLICIITRGLCSYNARLFNDDVTAIGASYWRRREFPNYARLHRGRIKGLITVGRELRQQHPSDLLSGAGTSRERSSRDVPAGQQITRVLLP